jgi:heme A synthase
MASLPRIHCRVTAFSAFLAALLSFLLAWTSNPAKGAGSLRLWTALTLLVMVTLVLLGAILVILHLDPVVSALQTMLATLSAITAAIAMVEVHHYYR